MTYNIRFDEPRDGSNSWSFRKAAVAGLIYEHAPAFVGIQEGLLHQVQYMDSVLSAYQYIGIGRDDGENEGEFCAIFYDTLSYSVREYSNFWLSDTSAQASFGWDAECRRVCTYGLFTNKKTGHQVWVFNTHFDHVGVQARKNSAHLLVQKMKAAIEHHPAPAILMGDFNATPEQEPIAIITMSLSDGLTLSNEPLHGPNGTFTGFRSNSPPERRIDYVFVQDFQVLRYAHLDDMREDGGFISDHLPVVARLKW